MSKRILGALFLGLTAVILFYQSDLYTSKNTTKEPKTDLLTDQDRPKTFRITPKKAKAAQVIKKVQSQKIDCFSKLLTMTKNNNFLERNAGKISEFVGPWLFTAAPPAYSDSQLMPDSKKFITALYLANLLEGRKNQNPDFEIAYDLLSQVSESSPDNSAPLAYLFYLDDILNKGKNQTSLAKKISRRFPVLLLTKIRQ